MRQKTHQRKEQILTAALSLIRDSGLKNLTIKNLSQKVGISEQAIYRHFENKTSILTSLILLFNQTLSDRLKKVARTKNILMNISDIIITHLSYLMTIRKWPL